MPVPKVGADVGLCECMSVRRCAGRPPLLFMYPYSLWRIEESSELGDMDTVRWAGEGVLRGELCAEPGSPSLRAWRPGTVCDLPQGLGKLAAAKAAAVAAAASSTVPEWWFWWRVRVVRRVKVFWQSA